MLSIVLMSETPITAVKIGKGEDYDEFNILDSPNIKFLGDRKVMVTIEESG
jgi:hypothetical protein